MKNTQHNNRDQKRPEEFNPVQMPLPFMCPSEKKVTKAGKAAGKNS